MQQLQQTPLQKFEGLPTWQQEQPAQYRRPYVKQLHMQRAQYAAEQSGADNNDMQPRLQQQAQQELLAQVPQQHAQQPKQKLLPPPQPSAAQRSKKVCVKC